MPCYSLVVLFYLSAWSVPSAGTCHKRIHREGAQVRMPTSQKFIPLIVASVNWIVIIGSTYVVSYYLSSSMLSPELMLSIPFHCCIVRPYNIWHYRTWSTSIQVMACCLMAPSHLLQGPMLIIFSLYVHVYETENMFSVKWYGNFTSICHVEHACVQVLTHY